MVRNSFRPASGATDQIQASNQSDTRQRTCAADEVIEQRCRLLAKAIILESFFRGMLLVICAPHKHRLLMGGARPDHPININIRVFPACCKR